MTQPRLLNFHHTLYPAQSLLADVLTRLLYRYIIIDITYTDLHEGIEGFADTNLISVRLHGTVRSGGVLWISGSLVTFLVYIGQVLLLRCP